MNDENQTQQTTQNNDEVISDEVKTDVPKLLRDQIKKEKEARAKIEAEKAQLKAELEAIKKAEEDKAKTLEEKLAEQKQKLEQIAKESETKEKVFNLEKKLLSEKVNPELSDLISSKAKDLLTSGVEMDDIISELKTSYPSAFSADDPKPMGKVGASATTTQTNTIGDLTPSKIDGMSWEQYQKVTRKN